MARSRNSRQIDHGSSTSNSRTPSPIPAKMPLDAMQTDSDIVKESSKRHKKSNQAPTESSGSQRKRLRTNRGDSGSVCYNMKYHPMDEFLRPNTFTTIQARQRLAHSSRQSSLLSTIESKHEISPVQRSRQISKNLQSAKEQLTSHKSGSLPSNNFNHETDPVPHSGKMPKNLQAPRERPTPTRSSTRLRARTSEPDEKKVYDMKYHPMDDVLKPKSRKRSSTWLNVVLLPSTSSPSPPSEIQAENPFTKSIPADWVNLEHFDRRVYLLQQGAPLHGNTLPLRWPQVVKSLVREGFFTEENFRAFGGIKTLTSRYETVRSGVEKFFRADPEIIDKRDWPVMHMEDMKVFEIGTDTKYWSNPRDSLVSPKSTKIMKKDASAANDDGVEDFAANSYAHARKGSYSNTTAPGSALRRQSDGYSIDNPVESPSDPMNSFGEAFDLLSPDSGQIDTIDSVDAMPRDPVISTPKKPSTSGFQIREDEAGRTPIIRKYIAMNPISPGTDIRKENFENHLDSASEADARNHYRLSPSGQRLVSIPSSSRSARFQVVGAF